jgi:hypothetical protein
VQERNEVIAASVANCGSIMTIFETNEVSMFTQRILACLIALSIGIPITMAAEKQDGARLMFNNTYSRIPTMLMPQADAIGSRVKSRGKEKTVYEGQYFDAQDNSKAARVTRELGGIVKLEGFKSGSASLSFDGKSTKGSDNGRIDNALLEVFASDSIEGLFDAIEGSAAIRLLGQGFKVDDKQDVNGNSVNYDIYEVTAPVKCRQTTIIRTKYYYFDSKTHNLHKTMYKDFTANPPAAIETYFSVWGKIEGSAYPAAVDYYENGKLIFSFIAESIAGGSSEKKAGE